MKKIIICEGKYDGIFMQNLMARLGVSENKIKVFSQEDVDMKQKKHAESTVLRQFTEKNPYNPYEFLVKLEGGKDSATKIFCRELVKCLNGVADLILLLDCDNLNVDQKINILEKSASNTYSQTTPILLNFEKKRKNEHLHHLSCGVSLQNSQTTIGLFQLTLFEKSLDTSCGIIDTDLEEDKRTKINQFIDREKILDFFKPIIL